MPPIALRLRVDRRIAITLGRRRHQVASSVLARKRQHIPRPNRTYIQRLDPIPQIVERARRRSQMKHSVKRPRIERGTNVMLHEREMPIFQQVFDIQFCVDNLITGVRQNSRAYLRHPWNSH